MDLGLWGLPWRWLYDHTLWTGLLSWWWSPLSDMRGESLQHTWKYYPSAQRPWKRCQIQGNPLPGMTASFSSMRKVCSIWQKVVLYNLMIFGNFTEWIWWWWYSTRKRLGSTPGPINVISYCFIIFFQVKKWVFSQACCKPCCFNVEGMAGRCRLGWTSKRVYFTTIPSNSGW